MTMQLSKKSIQRNPWIIYIPLWAQWIILNFTGPGSWIGPTVLKQLLSGPKTELNIIFPITWISAVTSFIIIIIQLKKHISLINSISISAASQFGAAFLFEFIFSLIAFQQYGHPILQDNPYYILIGLSWLIMPLTGIIYWSRNKFLYASLFVFIIGFVIWFFIGFPILGGIISLLLNYITKIAAFCIITSLFLKKNKKIKRNEVSF